MTYVKHALEQAGHDVYISRYVDGSAINIFFEAFGDATTALVQRYAGMGVKFAVVVTEIVTGATFNDFTENGEVTGYDPLYWRRRYRNFIKVAESTGRIWCLSPEQMQGYLQILPPQWCSLLPVGYLPSFAAVRQNPWPEKDIDFIFLGAGTERTQKIMSSLRDNGYKALDFKALLPNYIRDHLLARAKIALVPKPFDTWGHANFSLNYYHLINGAYVLAERCPHGNGLDAYIDHAGSGRLIEAGIELMKHGDLSGRAAENLARFRDEAPLEPAFSAFLREQLAV